MASARVKTIEKEKARERLTKWRSLGENGKDKMQPR